MYYHLEVLHRTLPNLTHHVASSAQAWDDLHLLHTPTPQFEVG